MNPVPNKPRVGVRLPEGSLFGPGGGGTIPHRSAAIGSETSTNVDNQNFISTLEREKPAGGCNHLADLGSLEGNSKDVEETSLL